ncbi:hypothetical protein Hanom_Chr04g00377161 [Helianthus anomalus]
MKALAKASSSIGAVGFRAQSPHRLRVRIERGVWGSVGVERGVWGSVEVERVESSKHNICFVGLLGVFGLFEGVLGVSGLLNGSMKIMWKKVESIVEESVKIIGESGELWRLIWCLIVKMDVKFI